MQGPRRGPASPDTPDPGIGRRPDVFVPCGFAILVTVRGAIEAIKADFGCLLVAVLFIVIMASTIIFATIFTPPAHNPFV